MTPKRQLADSAAPRLLPASTERACAACGDPLNLHDHWHTTPFPVETICCPCAQKAGYACRLAIEGEQAIIATGGAHR